MADFDPDAFIKAASAGPGDGFDPDAFLAAHAAQSEPGYVDQASNAVLGGLSATGKAIDSYAGAPTRAALASLQDDPRALGAAARAFKNQFGADPALAPTGRDIARKLGVSDAPIADTPQPVLDAVQEAARMDPYAALGAGYMNAAKAIPRSQAAGTAIDVAADPLTYLPVGKAAEVVGDAASRALGRSGDRLWIKATGAGGKDAAKFAPGTADAVRQLGYPGISPAGIADKAQAALDAAEASKTAMIKGPLAGATVDRNAIYNAIQGKIDSMSGDESKLGIVKHLNSRLEEIAGVAEKDGTAVPLAKSEDIRRGFDAKSKWNSSSDADAIEANKITANIYRKAGEDAATAVDPALGKQFKADKTTQKILIPVQDAAAKRALQLQQSPHGGLLDLVAMEAGGEAGQAAGGMPGRIAGMAVGYGAKAMRPRYASLGAATADALSKGAPMTGAAVAPAVAAARGVNFNQQESASPSGGQPAQQLANRAPAVGEAKWAQSGLQKLGIQDQELSTRLLADPKARQLLIQASDLAPGSKAMQKIMDQIKGISK